MFHDSEASVFFYKNIHTEHFSNLRAEKWLATLKINNILLAQNYQIPKKKPNL